MALPLAAFSSGSAASLEGKVMDVVDGEGLTVLSQGHLVKVKLIGVASPERNQSYAGVARQHLTDLILNKYVVVRYSSLREGYIVGQVFVGNMDVGAQMLRDGVGWYNKFDEANLSDVERQIYLGSEAAARSERRGLWQEDAPVAPWDYRRAQLAPPLTPASPATAVAYSSSPQNLRRPPTAVRRGTAAGLSSEDLMGGLVQPGSATGPPDVRPLSANGEPGRWLRYQPSDRHFSVLVPSDGVAISVPVLDADGNTMDLHFIVGSAGTSSYYMFWARGQNGNSTDTSAAAEAIRGLLTGINRSLERTGMLMTATPGRMLNVSGYAGRQYTLNAGPVTGTVRILSKQIGDDRELFVLGELKPMGSEPTGIDFLNSFRIGNPSPQKVASRKR